MWYDHIIDFEPPAKKRARFSKGMRPLRRKDGIPAGLGTGSSTTAQVNEVAAPLGSGTFGLAFALVGVDGHLIDLNCLRKARPVLQGYAPLRREGSIPAGLWTGSSTTAQVNEVAAPLGGGAFGLAFALVGVDGHLIDLNCLRRSAPGSPRVCAASSGGLHIRRSMDGFVDDGSSQRGGRATRRRGVWIGVCARGGRWPPHRLELLAKKRARFSKGMRRFVGRAAYPPVYGRVRRRRLKSTRWPRH